MARFDVCLACAFRHERCHCVCGAPNLVATGHCCLAGRLFPCLRWLLFGCTGQKQPLLIEAPNSKYVFFSWMSHLACLCRVRSRLSRTGWWRPVHEFFFFIKKKHTKHLLCSFIWSLKLFGWLSGSQVFVWHLGAGTTSLVFLFEFVDAPLFVIYK
jgi:hypothetical protein